MEIIIHPSYVTSINIIHGEVGRVMFNQLIFLTDHFWKSLFPVENVGKR